ncbi:hypothetical protein HDU76_011328, partial [Blyttiomyces sp. JEL0837]
ANGNPILPHVIMEPESIIQPQHGERENNDSKLAFNRDLSEWEYRKSQHDKLVEKFKTDSDHNESARVILLKCFPVSITDRFKNIRTCFELLASLRTHFAINQRDQRPDRSKWINIWTATELKTSDCAAIVPINVFLTKLAHQTSGYYSMVSGHENIEVTHEFIIAMVIAKLRAAQIHHSYFFSKNEHLSNGVSRDDPNYQDGNVIMANWCVVAQRAIADDPSGVNAWYKKYTAESGGYPDEIKAAAVKGGPKRKQGNTKDDTNKPEGKRQKFYCSHHGYNKSHTDAKCRILHPELADDEEGNTGGSDKSGGSNGGGGGTQATKKAKQTCRYSRKVAAKVARENKAKASMVVVDKVDTEDESDGDEDEEMDKDQLNNEFRMHTRVVVDAPVNTDFSTTSNESSDINIEHTD